MIIHHTRSLFLIHQALSSLRSSYSAKRNCNFVEIRQVCSYSHVCRANNYRW